MEARLPLFYYVLLLSVTRIRKSGAAMSEKICIFALFRIVY